MRPKGVESNHFAYHLDQLVRNGLVQKKDRDYSLTPKGLALADKISHDNISIRLQPHIVTSVYARSGETGRIVLYKHAFQPYLGIYGLPQGRIHYEESVSDAASRELEEKTGLKDIPLKHRGMLYVTTKKGGEDISKILIHVFEGNIDGEPKLSDPTLKGGSMWGSEKELKANECMPGFSEIIELLKTNTDDLFFAEIEANLP